MPSTGLAMPARWRGRGRRAGGARRRWAAVANGPVRSLEGDEAGQRRGSSVAGRGGPQLALAGELLERSGKPFTADLAAGRAGVDRGVQLPEPLQRSEEHTSELQSRPHLVCRLL